MKVLTFLRFYLPSKFRGYFSFEPSFGFRETVWYVNEYSDGTIETQKILNRQIYDIKLDLSTEIYKIYNVNEKDIDKIKHSIKPQIIYEYTPEQNQEEYPEIIGKNNSVKYSITTTLTSRSKEDTEQKNEIVDYKKDESVDEEKDESVDEENDESVDEENDESVDEENDESVDEENDESVDEENDEQASYIYNEFCRFKIEQTYNIGEARDDNPEPFSSIRAELEILPAKCLTLKADAEWCQYEEDLLSHNVAVNLSNDRGDNLFVEHRFSLDSSESFYLNANIKISDSLEVFGEYERNIYESRDIKTGVGFLYKSQCWSIRCSYEDEKENDRRYGFIVNLYGLGEIGTELLGHLVEEPHY